MVPVLQVRTDLQLVQCLVLAASNFCPEADDLIPCRISQLCLVMAAASSSSSSSSSLIIASEPYFWPCSRTLQQTTWLHHQHPIEHRPPDGARALQSEYALTGLSNIRDSKCWQHCNMHWQSGMRSCHGPIKCVTGVYSTLFEGWAIVHKKESLDKWLT